MPRVSPPEAITIRNRSHEAPVRVRLASSVLPARAGDCRFELFFAHACAPLHAKTGGLAVQLVAGWLTALLFPRSSLRASGARLVLECLADVDQQLPELSGETPGVAIEDVFHIAKWAAFHRLTVQPSFIPFNVSTRDALRTLP